MNEPHNEDSPEMVLCPKKLRRAGMKALRVLDALLESEDETIRLGASKTLVILCQDRDVFEHHIKAINEADKDGWR